MAASATPLVVDVTLESSASPAEVEAVSAAFERAQFEATVTAGYEVRSAEIVVVVALVVLPAGCYLRGFFGRLGELHAEEFNDIIRDLVRNLGRGRTTPLVQSTSEPLEVLLQEDLPDEALRQLRDGEFPETAESGQLKFDRGTGRWRDAWEIVGEQSD